MRASTVAAWAIRAKSWASWTEFDASMAKPVARAAMTSLWSQKMDSAWAASDRAATWITAAVNSPAILLRQVLAPPHRLIPAHSLAWPAWSIGRPNQPYPVPFHEAGLQIAVIETPGDANSRSHSAHEENENRKTEDQGVG